MNNLSSVRHAEFIILLIVFLIGGCDFRRLVMAMASNRADLRTLRRFICDTDLILATTVALPENRTARCRELLKTALALTDDLIAHAKLPEDEERARKGGLVIAQRGSEYFRQLAARRKTRGGGRTRKESE